MLKAGENPANVALIKRVEQLEQQVSLLVEIMKRSRRADLMAAAAIEKAFGKADPL